MNDAPDNIKRRRVRFQADEGSVGWVDLRRSSESEEFFCQLPGIILNESYAGCALLMLPNKSFVAGHEVWVQVGELSPLRAEIMWVIPFSDEAAKIGLRYFSA